jgi:hypothetical protein
MPIYNSSRFIASAIIAGFIALPGAAIAQTATQPPATQAPASEQQQAIEPSEEQLESFATATIQIVQIQEEAQQRMQAAVEESGLTVEEYNQIAQAAQADPEIDQALQRLIQDRLGG